MTRAAACTAAEHRIAGPGEQAHDRLWPKLAVCLVGGFMTVLDISIVNVALPDIRGGLGA